MRCSSFAALCAGRGGAVCGRILRIAKVLAVGLLVSACASSHASYEYPSNVGMSAPSRVAVAVPKVELEDDGLAVQAPPRVRKNAEPDDPSEPFSPNYGPGPLPGEPAAEPVKRQPVNLPAGRARRANGSTVILRSRVSPMSAQEAEDIIAQAVVAHEVRNP